jgi:hypothetical protein
VFTVVLLILSLKYYLLQTWELFCFGFKRKVMFLESSGNILYAVN